MSAVSVRPAVLAEDDSTLREILRRALESAGFRVEVAADGLQALEACRKVKPALIVTDIVMPGLRGPEFLEKARAEGIDAPALIVSTDVDGEALALERKDPKIATLKKPFPLGEFLKAIQALLDSR
ncbi:MAG TPA: response regulator [Planctomycetota bacterium]